MPQMSPGLWFYIVVMLIMFAMATMVMIYFISGLTTSGVGDKHRSVNSLIWQW